MVKVKNNTDHLFCIGHPGQYQVLLGNAKFPSNHNLRERSMTTTFSYRIIRIQKLQELNENIYECAICMKETEKSKFYS